MKLNNFFNNLFNVVAKKDEDKIYHYLLEYKNDILDVSVEDINLWDNIDLSNKLILDCDDNNQFFLVMYNNGYEVIRLSETQICKIECYTEDEYFYVQLFSNGFLEKMMIEIQIEPYLAIHIKNII